MNTESRPASQRRSDRRVLKALGSGLSHHLSGTTLEPPPEDLLSLLAQADRNRAASKPA